MPILCERHTTSKISAFEDLTSISTYGFRGEALASISHIAHLTVTTKTKDSALAWRAHYLDGKLAPAKPGQAAEPKGVAGRPGTQITVEDLFFNVPTRRRAFRSYADEYNKIVDMVGRYGVHCKGVAFTCKKSGESSNTLSIQAQATVIDRIRQIHGSSVANELIELSVSDDRWGFKADGYITNANYHVKKTTILLFINHRAVESTHIKKAVEQTYSAFLPKGGHPFIYLSLEIDPGRVDVNVHPTKREVHFLNEDEIIQAICKQIDAELSAVDSSRAFKMQTLLPGAKPVNDSDSDSDIPMVKATPIGRKARRNSNDLIRTDTSERKITTMFSPAVFRPASKVFNTNSDTNANANANANTKTGAGDEEPFAVPEPISYETNDREHAQCRLRSVKQLRAEAREDMHNDLTEIFSTHTFVGIVDERRRLAAMQGGVKLYLVDYGHACFDFFYQLGLTDFGNFGTIHFNPVLDLRELLNIAAEQEKETLGASDEDFPLDVIVNKVADQLIERREMLQEYFSFEISPAGELLSIPLLIKGYTPPIAKLPRFLLRLGPNVDWTEEKACFQTFLKELATFYVPEQLPTEQGTGGRGQGQKEEDDEDMKMDAEEQEEEDDDVEGEEIPQEVRTRRQHVRWAIEHIFFPAFKARLVATKSLMEGGVLEVASLKGLYKVFERC